MIKITKKIFILQLVIAVLFSIIPSNTMYAAIKFTVKDETIRSDLLKYSIPITINGSEQRFKGNKEEVTVFTIDSKKLSKDKKTTTVTAVLYIDRNVATVKAEAIVKYKLKNSKWKLSSVKYTSTSLSNISLVGTWNGTYINSRGTTKATIDVSDITADGFLVDTIFSFGPTPTNPDSPSGSYYVIGGYDINLGIVVFKADIWIDQPTNWHTLDFKCYLDLVHKKIIGDNNLIIEKE